MKVIKTNISELKKTNCDAIITIGMFDGFHIYHKLIIQAVEQIGRANNLAKIIFSFESKPNMKIENLVDEQTKITYLRKNFDIDYFYIIEVDHKLIQTTKDQFIDILKTKLNVKQLVEGSDFRFGFQKQGSINDLITSFGPKNVHVFERNNDFSSTKLRELVKHKRIDLLKEITDVNFEKKA